MQAVREGKVVSYDPKPRLGERRAVSFLRVCSKCGKAGFHAKTCPAKGASP